MLNSSASGNLSWLACLLGEEIDAIVIGLARGRVAHPYYAVLGGAKVAGKGGKLKTIRGLLGTADKIVIGGAMLYPFLLAKDRTAGQDPLGREEGEVASDVEAAKKLLDDAGDRIELPTGLRGLVGDTVREFDVEQEECPEEFRMRDIQADSLDGAVAGA